MVYQFRCNLRTFDLWQLTMEKIYCSVAGVCNAIYTIAFILVTVKLWDSSTIAWNGLLVLLCSLFLVIQPALIYLRAKKQVAGIPKEIEIGLDDYGVHIMTSKQNSHWKWKSIKQVRKERNMMILYTNTVRGWMIPFRVLDGRKDEVLDYVMNHKKIKDLL